MNVEGRELVVTTSVGVARYLDDPRDADIRSSTRDVAMYRAKDEGRNSFQPSSRR